MLKYSIPFQIIKLILLFTIHSLTLSSQKKNISYNFRLFLVKYVQKPYSNNNNVLVEPIKKLCQFQFFKVEIVQLSLHVYSLIFHN